MSLMAGVALLLLSLLTVVVVGGWVWDCLVIVGIWFEMRSVVRNSAARMLLSDFVGILFILFLDLSISAVSVVLTNKASLIAATIGTGAESSCCTW